MTSSSFMVLITFYADHSQNFLQLKSLSDAQGLYILPPTRYFHFDDPQALWK